MDTTKTTAERIAARYDNDGQRWHAVDDGRNIDSVCAGAGTATHNDERDATRYDFADGSALVVSGGGWDQPLSAETAGCFCWAGCQEHARECPASEVDVEGFLRESGDDTEDEGGDLVGDDGQLQPRPDLDEGGA